MDIQPTSNTPPEVIESVIKELKSKASENHRVATTYFFMIIGVIIAGLAVFIFAYRFTSSSEVEDSLIESKQLLNVGLSKTATLLDSVKEDMLHFHLKEEYFDTVAYILQPYIYKSDEVVDPEKQKAGILNAFNLMRQKYHTAFTSMYDYGFRPAKLQSMPRRNLYKSLEDKNLSVDSISSFYYEKVKADLLTSLKTSNYELYNLINTTAIRFGSIVMLLFLVQILVRVFRYNARLANFYTARAHALELYSKDQKNQNFKDFVSCLSPDALDIGMSKSPSDQLIELAKLFSKNP